MSLYFNSPKLIGKGLKAAISVGNRTQAWFEIRYGSNGSNELGIAKRRYVESQVFGLYDNPTSVTAAQARETYAYLSQSAIRRKIVDYERNHGTAIDSATPDAEQKALSMAVTDYPQLEASYIPLSLVDTLDPAKKALLGDLRAASAAIAGKLQDNQWLSTNVYVAPDPNVGASLNSKPYETGRFLVVGANDLMLGGGGNDTLLSGLGDDALFGGTGYDRLEAGAGDDLLVGGSNDDTLVGGAGNDTYYFDGFFGKDQIEDDIDGNGGIKIGSGVLDGAGAKYSVGKGWVDAVGVSYSFVDSGQDKVTLTISGGPLGAGEIAIKDFSLSKAASADGYLGLKLKRSAQGALTTATTLNPYSVADAVVGAIAATVSELNGLALRWFTNVAAALNDTITVRVASGNAAIWELITGAETLDLTSPVTLDLSAGDMSSTCQPPTSKCAR